MCFASLCAGVVLLLFAGRIEISALRNFSCALTVGVEALFVLRILSDFCQ